MNEKACCVTGHRDIPEHKVNYITKELHKEIKRAIEDGFTTFVTCFNDGVDLIFADIMLDIKKKNPDLNLEAMIPFGSRLKKSTKSVQKLIESCNEVKVYQEKYTPSCYLNCNRSMISSSDRVIAVYDGRDSGKTLFSIRYAHSQKKEVRLINIS